VFIVIAVADLMFQSRIVDAAHRLGYDYRIAGSSEVAGKGVEEGAAFVIDLHLDAGVLGLIGMAASQGARVLAFGRHTEAALLREAREAGADTVVARSTLVEELGELLRAM
jgi:hypothetical protein